MVLKFQRHSPLPHPLAAGEKWAYFSLTCSSLLAAAQTFSPNESFPFYSMDIHEWVHVHYRSANLRRLWQTARWLKNRKVRVTQKHTHSLETSVPVFQLELIVHLAN